MRSDDRRIIRRAAFVFVLMMAGLVTVVQQRAIGRLADANERQSEAIAALYEVHLGR